MLSRLDRFSRRQRKPATSPRPLVASPQRPDPVPRQHSIRNGRPLSGWQQESGEDTAAAEGTGRTGRTSESGWVSQGVALSIRGPGGSSTSTSTPGHAISTALVRRRPTTPLVERARLPDEVVVVGPSLCLISGRTLTFCSGSTVETWCSTHELEDQRSLTDAWCDEFAVLAADPPHRLSTIDQHSPGRKDLVARLGDFDVGHSLGRFERMTLLGAIGAPD